MFDTNYIYKRFIVIAFIQHDGDYIRRSFDTLEEAKEFIETDTKVYEGHEVFDCDKRTIVF